MNAILHNTCRSKAKIYHHELNQSDIKRNVGSPKHDDQFDFPDIYVRSAMYKTEPCFLLIRFGLITNFSPMDTNLIHFPKEKSLLFLTRYKTLPNKKHGLVYNVPS